MSDRDCPHGHKLGKCDSCELIEAEKRIAALEKERDRIAKFIYQDPPFDIYGGIDLHLRACHHAEDNEPLQEHYYQAFLDCTNEAI